MVSENTNHQHATGTAAGKEDGEDIVREAALDETIEDSFPASDPPSSNPNPRDTAALARKRPRRRRPHPGRSI